MSRVRNCGTLGPEARWEKGENPVLDEARWNKGLSMRHNNNGTILVDILEVERDRYKDPEDIKGIIINDYQECLEKQWLNELRKKYKVSVNSNNLEKLKTEMRR